jgi:hypothetical protein
MMMGCEAMTEVAIRFNPNVWGGYAWSLYRRANLFCEWEIDGSAMSKPGAIAMVKPGETIVEADSEPPPPLVSIPNAKQLKCKHNKPGEVRYQQAFGMKDIYRFEICDTCKSVILARGKVPWHLLPKGYALLRIEP